MKSISPALFTQLLNESTPLEIDGFGPKVVESADGKTIHKLFRRKRWLSSALLYPYAVRFARNAERLGALGFETVKVRELSTCRPLGYHLVSYDKAPGRSLRELIRECPDPEYFVELGQLMARLHRQGVYFRSLHLGNVLRDGERGLALIDIADMRFSGQPLWATTRVRNFRRLLQRSDDRGLFSSSDWRTLVDAYNQKDGVDPSLLRTIKRLGDSLAA